MIPVTFKQAHKSITLECPLPDCENLGQGLYRFTLNKTLTARLFAHLTPHKKIQIVDGKRIEQTFDTFTGIVTYKPIAPPPARQKKDSIRIIGETIDGASVYAVINNFVYFIPKQGRERATGITEQKFRKQVQKGETRARLYEKTEKIPVKMEKLSSTSV